MIKNQVMNQTLGWKMKGKHPWIWKHTYLQKEPVKNLLQKELVKNLLQKEHVKKIKLLRTWGVYFKKKNLECAWAADEDVCFQKKKKKKKNLGCAWANEGDMCF